MIKNDEPGVLISRTPQSPPPQVTPGYNKLNKNVSMAIIKNLLLSYIYVWVKKGGAFWMYPTSVTPDNMLFGYQWDDRFWHFVKLDIDEIDNIY